MRQRFFWPPPPAEPRIEYIKHYLAVEDIERGKTNRFVEAIIGRDAPSTLFKSPADVASDGRRVLVSDGGRRQVLVLDRTLGQLRYLKSATGAVMSFGAPYGVAFDPEGNAYVSDTYAKKIFVFGPDERLTRIVGEERLSRPTGLAVDPDRRRLYVADTSSHQIIAFDLNGDHLSAWGERGPGTGTFNFPTDVDVDADGNVYVLDSLNAQVQVLDSSGAFVRSFGERGTASGSFQVPKGIAVSPTGLVIVTDSMAKRFVIFSTTGDYLLSVGGRQFFSKTVSPGGFYLPAGIDIDQDSTIWVVDGLNRVVQQFQHLTDNYLKEHPIDAQDVYVPVLNRD